MKSPEWMKYAMLASDPENTLAIAFLGGLGKPFISLLRKLFEILFKTGYQLA
ncbi:hypothetical protein ACVRUF_003618 [Cronobacter turicensis]